MHGQGLFAAVLYAGSYNRRRHSEAEPKNLIE